MKTITYEEFLKYKPCYLEDPEKKKLMDNIAARKKYWSALDVLALEEIPIKDRLWVVLRPELIDNSILYEFALKCAEKEFTYHNELPTACIKAIHIKREWLRNRKKLNKIIKETWDKAKKEWQNKNYPEFKLLYIACCACLDRAYNVSTCVSEKNVSYEWQIEELKNMLAHDTLKSYVTFYC